MIRARSQLSDCKAHRIPISDCLDKTDPFLCCGNRWSTSGGRLLCSWTWLSITQWVLGACYGIHTSRDAVFNFRQVLCYWESDHVLCALNWKKDCFHIECTIFTILFTLRNALKHGLIRMLTFFLAVVVLVPIFWSWVIHQYYERNNFQLPGVFI